MKQKVVPLQIKIIFLDGRAIYPKWYKLDIINTDDDMRKHCLSKMLFDSTSTYRDNTSDSPIDMQWGYILCSQEFATEAQHMFPELVEIINKKEFEKIYNTKITIALPEKIYDIKTLHGLQLELQLTKELKKSTTMLKKNILKTIDPYSPELGIQINRLKTLKDYSAKMNFEIL